MMSGSFSFSRTVFAATLSLLQLYRRHVSPRTRFACAHRVGHGGHSCSAAFEAHLLSENSGSAFRALREQLSACAAASRSLREDGVRYDKDGKIIIPCIPFI